MATASNLRILWTITLLIAVCLVSIPVQAQYGGGTGEPNDPYRIATAEDLMLLGESPEDYDKHFILTADIDLDPNLPGRRVFDKAVIGADSATPFTGVFDGNGRTISHLTIAGVSYLGLFGQLGSGATISNLGLEAVEVNGTGAHIGGLVGSNGGSITTSYSTGTVTGTGSAVGGLVGDNSLSSGWGWGSDTTIPGSIAASHSTSAVSGEIGVGGLVGSNGGSITTSYSTGVISGETGIGGLVGVNSVWGYDTTISGSIAASYSTGVVSGDGDVGGLVGNNWRGSIAASYSTGAVDGNDFAGGLVGSGSEHDVMSCFWDIQTSGQTSSAGAVGLTTAEMQDISTYLDAGWDFVDEIFNGTCECWQISAGEYPTLHYPVMPQGLGTAEEPYLIRDARDLGTVWFRPRAHYRLEASVDLSGVTWSMAVIPRFCGSFDGKGCVISNLHIQGGSYLGLFGELASGATISNLGLEAVHVNGTGGLVGGLVGYNDDGDITSSCSTGTVSGDDRVGGLVGYNDDGNITSSCSTGTVSGDDRVGGLVGYNDDGDITSSYSTATVSGDNYVGGLVGSSGGNITTSYSAGTLSGDGCVGGLVGQNNGDVTNCFWDMDTSGFAYSDGGVGLTTAQMMDPEMYALNGWANDPSWILDAGRDYPRLAWEGTPGQIIPEPGIDWLDGQGTEQEPYRVDTADQLIFLGRASALWDKHFILGADINLDPNLQGRQVLSQAVIEVFSGVFDGNDHTISHLTIAGESYLGLFGELASGATVSNLDLQAIDVKGTGSYIGGLVGYNDDGNITNSYSTGTVGGDDHVGGLVGRNNGSITMSYSIGTVNGDGAVGGLVGRNYGSITTSYSTGTVTGDGQVGGLAGYNGDTITTSYSIGTVSGDDYVGGLVGDNSGTITTSYSTSAVSGDDKVGGLVGGNWRGSIAMSYSTGTVIGDDRVGGLVGWNSAGAITSCYSAGPVTGGSSVGGLVGGQYQSSCSASFWDVETSGLVTSGGGIGKTTAEMQTVSTFLDAGWDFVGETENGFEDTWTICEGIDYPRLAWELNCIGCTHEDYLEWVSFGKPECWCYPTQCHGDVDGLVGGSANAGYYHVGPTDLNVLISAWLVKEPPHGPGIASIPDGICADFAHDHGGSEKTGTYRVGPSDLCILVNNWLVKERPHGPGLPRRGSTGVRWLLDDSLPDFSGDGRADLLWRHASEGYQTATIMDGLTMANSGWLGGDLDWQIVATPDLDGDGKSDLLWRQVSTGYHFATIMDGLAMGSSGWLGGDLDWQIVATPDFNGDGKADLLWRHNSGGYQTATIMDGLTRGSWGQLGGNTDLQIVATPDFNGDGKADLLRRQLSTGYHTASIMDGLTSVADALLGGDLDWQIVATPDFNGDGKSDLLWDQLSTGYQKVSIMDGLTIVGNGWIGGNLDWAVESTPDLNGDGKSDLLWRQLSTGYQTATIMDGITMVGSGWIGGNSDWEVVATGDFDGDGKSDLLWKQWSTGYHTATIMDGLTMDSSGWIGGDLDWGVQPVP